MTRWLTNLLTEALELSRHSNTWRAKSTQDTRALEGHLRTRALKALGHLGIWGTQALEGNVVTRKLKALGHLVY